MMGHPAWQPDRCTISGDFLRASLHIGRDHYCVQGHFPGRPIFPGLMLVAAAWGLVRRAVPCKENAVWKSKSVTARFHAPVIPPAMIEFELRLKREDEVRLDATGNIWVSGQRVSSIRLQLEKAACAGGP